MVMLLDVTLTVDGKKVDLNSFVEKILGGTVVGAVASLRGVTKDWKEMEIRVKK
jgi:hypothetical protein